MARDRCLKWLIVGSLAVVCVALDLLSKAVATARLQPGELHELASFFAIQLTNNQGVAFGLLGGRLPLIVIANVAAMGIVAFYVAIDPWTILPGLGGGFVIGGSLGNLAQRIAQGHVTDFLKFPYWPNFNVADIFIVLGISLVVVSLVLELFYGRRDAGMAGRSDGKTGGASRGGGSPDGGRRR